MGRKRNSDKFYLGSKITLDGVCSHEIKRPPSPWKKSYDKTRHCIGKQRHCFADKVKVMVFPVVMYGCESWTIKSAEELMISNCGAGEDS